MHGGTVLGGAAVQSAQPAEGEQAQMCRASVEQHLAQQSEGAVQGGPAFPARPSLSDTAGCVPDQQTVGAASQAVGLVEGCQALSAAPTLHTQGTPIIVRLPQCKIPLNIVPRGPKRNLKHWKTVPNGLPEGC